MRGTPNPEAMLLFGRIARRHRFVLPEDLEECLGIAEKLRMMGLSKRLGEILVDQGYLSDDHVRWILQRQDPAGPVPPEASRFGDLAVLNGFVAARVVQRGLKAQRKGAKKGPALRIGEVLVGEGSMRAPDRDAILALQQRLRAATGTGADPGAPPFLLLEAPALPKRRRLLLAALVALLLLGLAAFAAFLLARSGSPG
jgi:hypothetical protein